ncbi:hypothetical protein O6H91_Y241200 [Diphasiastrum complanatum]|nr:hypothetical protein O6H91_Y241200 [Diphasiastrum complanatum]
MHTHISLSHTQSDLLLLFRGTWAAGLGASVVRSAIATMPDHKRSSTDVCGHSAMNEPHETKGENFFSDVSLAENQNNVKYTKDGSVDIFGRRAIRAKSGGFRTLPFILGVQFLVTMAYYALATNLVRYLSTKFHENVASASTAVANWNGSTTLFSVLGAFLADSYFGRFWTSGMLLANFTTILSSLQSIDCPSSSAACQTASSKRKSIFYLALYIQALGIGAFQPCNVSFGADQYDEQHKLENPWKSRFFSLVYVTGSCGSLIGNTFLIYLEQNVSYTWGFGVCTIFLGLSVVIYLSGIPLFRYQKPKGNPLTRIAQVLCASVRKWHLKCPLDGSELYELSQVTGSRQLHHSNKFRFLDKAAIKIDGDIDKEGTRNLWKLCTVTQVEEAKFLFRVLPIWASNVYYSTLYIQTLTLFVEQASTMDLRLGNFSIPPASMGVFETLSVCFWTFAYEKWVVPVARRCTGHPRGLTLLQRMGTGLAVVTSAMVAAAVVEMHRLNVIERHDLSGKPDATVPMSVFWLIPQYFLVGASETFSYVGQYEFFYDQAPDDIRGLSSGLQFTTLACGNFLSSLMVSIISQVTRHGGKPGWISNNLNAGHIDYFYWLLALLGMVNFILYLICANWYEYTDVTNSESS